MSLPFSFLWPCTGLLEPQYLTAGVSPTNFLLNCAMHTGSNDSPSTVQPLRILAFGDSLVAGFALSRKAGFTVQLEKALIAAGFTAEVINAGIPGDTSAGGRSRLGQALDLQPDLVLLEFGANDNLLGVPPTELETNLEEIILRLRESGIPVLLTGIKPLRNLGTDYQAEFSEVFSRLADKHQVPFYADFLDGVAGRPELNKADGIHPNPKGVKEIVRRLSPLVIETLKGLAKARP
ncbi:arylesterase [Syntrophotalea acetylenivorans]|nr:arylesterase [Syntrophotalea acetylenivorans]